MTSSPSRRAAPLPPEQRRAALIAATVATMRRLGRMASTREIAEAAGVAEGTIFRVFASKEELIDAAVHETFSPGPYLAMIDEIDPGLALRDRLVAFVEITQQRFVQNFEVMAAAGLTAPPPHRQDVEKDRKDWHRQIERRLTRLLGDDEGDVTVDGRTLFRYLRMLTFSGSHKHLSEGEIMTPAQIVDTVLYGVSVEPQTRRGRKATDMHSRATNGA